MSTQSTIKKLAILLGIFLSGVGGLSNNNALLVIGLILSIGGASMLYLK